MKRIIAALVFLASAFGLIGAGAPYIVNYSGFGTNILANSASSGNTNFVSVWGCAIDPLANGVYTYSRMSGAVAIYVNPVSGYGLAYDIGLTVVSYMSIGTTS